jgi:septal ring-binding cell division protein DamX
MIRKMLRHLIFWSCTATLFISGCASTPDYSDDQARFDAGKEAFLAREYIQAAKLFEPLALRGHSQAQYTLGYLYYYGLGISQNGELGKKWISSAAGKGNQLAIKALGLISKEQVSVKHEEKVEELEKTEPEAVEEVEISTSNIDSTSTQHTLNTEELEVAKKPLSTASIHKSIETKPITTIQEVNSGQTQHAWIFKQPSSNYTIHLASLNNEAEAKKFISKNSLSEPTASFPYRRYGRDIYAIVYGSFSTFTEAKEALVNLPDDLAKSSPWIRNFTQVQALLQQP